MSQQQTIAKEIELSGRGLFTGEPTKVPCKPGLPGHKVVAITALKPGDVFSINSREVIEQLNTDYKLRG